MFVIHRIRLVVYNVCVRLYDKTNKYGFSEWKYDFLSEWEVTIKNVILEFQIILAAYMNEIFFEKENIWLFHSESLDNLKCNKYR